MRRHLESLRFAILSLQSHSLATPLLGSKVQERPIHTLSWRWSWRCTKKWAKAFKTCLSSEVAERHCDQIIMVNFHCFSWIWGSQDCNNAKHWRKSQVWHKHTPSLSPMPWGVGVSAIDKSCQTNFQDCRLDDFSCVVWPGGSPRWNKNYRNVESHQSKIKNNQSIAVTWSISNVMIRNATCGFSSQGMQYLKECKSDVCNVHVVQSQAQHDDERRLRSPVQMSHLWKFIW